MNISDGVCESLIGTCEEVMEFLEDQLDVVDGGDGRQLPNKAMILRTALGMACERVKGHTYRDPAAPLAAALRRAAAPKGWAILHADCKRWRTMDSLGMPDWTNDPGRALVCRLKEHIERYAEDDPDDVRVVEVDW